MEDAFFWIGALILGLVIFALLAMKFIVAVYFPFVDAKDRIETKILFSETHEQRRFWLRERKRLYVSLVPFVGGFIASQMKNKKA